MPAWVPIHRFRSESTKMESTVLLTSGVGAFSRVTLSPRILKMPSPMEPAHNSPLGASRRVRMVPKTPGTGSKLYLPSRSRYNPPTVPTQIAPSAVCRMDFTLLRLSLSGSTYSWAWPSCNE